VTGVNVRGKSSFDRLFVISGIKNPFIPVTGARHFTVISAFRKSIKLGHHPQILADSNK
jgi:hypothetical protein